MIRTKISSSIELVANIGIIIGLLLVAYQIAQQEKVVETEEDTIVFGSSTIYYEKLAGENPAAALATALEDPGSLSTEDHLILHGFYMAEIGRIARVEAVWEEEQIPLSAAYRIRGIISNPYGYAWWRATEERLGFVTPKTRLAVNRLIAEQGLESDMELFKEIERLLESSKTDEGGGA